MTLRTRTSHPSGATSGPGRSRLSDSRLRHRRARSGHRAPHQHDPHPHRQPAKRPGEGPGPGAVRRRAEALLGGSSPPPAPAQPEADPRTLPDEAAGLPSGTARRLAVRERLPLWMQARCGVEPRTVAAVGVVLVAAVGFAGQQYWSARPR
ncbi:ComEA family DNA-binding protein, partial [Streptomyces lunaelactis]|nr:ComEA family DNA-binding protein [Streptomyces lunaelactis]